MKILILTPYPKSIAPSQRFRFEQYLKILTENGYEYEYHSFLNLKTWKILHQPGKFLQKGIAILFAFLKRFLLMLRVGKFDQVFIHREASHIGPPIFEFYITKILRKKVIYDFDDAIWLPNYSEHNAKFNKLKMYGKVKRIIQWASVVSVGNEYLKEYAINYNKNVKVNPTTIDTENYHNPELYKKENNNLPVIGWTGTLTTAQYIEFLIPVFQKLEKKYNFEFRMISNEDPKFPIRSLVYHPWSKETEIQDLMKFDIGIMPLKDDIWAKGKCGFKALQYMSLGVPAIVSPVGVNTKIVDHTLNGFICENTEQWYTALEQFLEKSTSTDMSIAAREKIVNNYSVQSNTPNFLSLFF
ncbi:glycosyltransferase family 4 protein [Flammeovirga sp. EKP202]|uniref:glycosyltransferase family 4 protein n=1 Tax=Flammeovirga sp. EKP202 TaxID=2770592 RepID=UPI00165F5108|nr:glycosyltransferase family 4 protein [Flammeovirga sp. EKP202]MBD0400823.1 glycosyltransferase family 4 protein [Flammeovirga sp. EKP202]